MEYLTLVMKHQVIEVVLDMVFYRHFRNRFGVHSYELDENHLETYNILFKLTTLRKYSTDNCYSQMLYCFF